jgi:hypothetical protein
MADMWRKYICDLLLGTLRFRIRVLYSDRGILRQWHTQEFFSGVEGYARNFFEGVQQIQLRTEGIKGDLGKVAP